MTTRTIENRYWEKFRVAYIKQHPDEEIGLTADGCYARAFYHRTDAKQWEAWTLWIANEKLLGRL